VSQRYPRTSGGKNPEKSLAAGGKGARGEGRHSIAKLHLLSRIICNSSIKFYMAIVTLLHTTGSYEEMTAINFCSF
jgi:hypothetical protein